MKRARVRATGPDLSLRLRGPEPSDPRHSQERAGPALSSTHLPVQHEWVRGNGRWQRFRTLRHAKWEPRKRNKHGVSAPKPFKSSFMAGRVAAPTAKSRDEGPDALRPRAPRGHAVCRRSPLLSSPPPPRAPSRTMGDANNGTGDATMPANTTMPANCCHRASACAGTFESASARFRSPRRSFRSARLWLEEESGPTSRTHARLTGARV